MATRKQIEDVCDELVSLIKETHQQAKETIIHQFEQLQAENKELESENLKLKNTVLGVYNHLHKHHYSGAFYELETLLDEIMEQASIDR